MRRLVAPRFIPGFLCDGDDISIVRDYLVYAFRVVSCFSERSLVIMRISKCLSRTTLSQ